MASLTATTSPFRSIPDQVLGAGGRDESLASISSRSQAVFSRTFEELEADWLAMLRG